MEDFLRKEKFPSRPDGMMMCTGEERRSEHINDAAVKKRVWGDSRKLESRGGIVSESGMLKDDWRTQQGRRLEDEEKRWKNGDPGCNRSLNGSSWASDAQPNYGG